MALATAVKDQDPTVAAELRKLTSIPVRAAALKTVAETLAKGIDKEREAHGIKADESGSRTDVDEFISELGKLVPN